MVAMGQYGPITLLPEREMTGTFTVKKIQKLNRPGHHCQPDEHYSFTDCLRSFVTRTSSCSIDILANKYNCTSEGLVKLNQVMNELKFYNKRNITERTGCLPKCTSHKYSFEFHSNTDYVDATLWRKNWISSFYLSTRTTISTTSVESYSYDEQVKVANILLKICNTKVDNSRIS